MLLPMHFACDLSGLGSIAGNGDTKSYFQFRRMAAVSIWLLKKMGGMYSYVFVLVCVYVCVYIYNIYIYMYTYIYIYRWGGYGSGRYIYVN
jgi:hypothetical protein